MFLDGVKFTHRSVNKVEEFINSCIKLLGPEPFLWISFQSNVLCDLGDPDHHFDQYFHKMIATLSNNFGFICPKLNMNMRNVKEISELAQVVEYRGATGFKISKVIDTLSCQSSISTSTKPYIIPIESAKLNEQFDEVFDLAVDGTIPNAILFSSKYGSSVYNLDIQKVRKALIRHGIKNEDIFHHSLTCTPENTKEEYKNTKEDMKNFLLNPNGVLICETTLFIGMEAKSVLYFANDRHFRNSLRCHLMRATSDLKVIYTFDKMSNSNIVFGLAPVSSQFISCEKIIQKAAWICQTCESHQIICKYCYISCHRGHQAERRFVLFEFKKEYVECECSLKSSTCIRRYFK